MGLYKKFLLFVVLCFMLQLLFVKDVNASFNPFSRPNNIFGIHILFPEELQRAATLVNTSSGEWGYVTIPIQVGDKDIGKWQNFMITAYKYKLIPILRLATEADYHGTGVWRKPKESDILDFANFLNSIYWPIKNRYIILFNEVNRSDEWGGDAPNPSDYASLLSYAIDVFKSKNNDFFVISAGLDNAAPNFPGKFMDEYIFLKGMSEAQPGIFNKIDGISSHSYPNPGFIEPPQSLIKTGITSYRYEYDLISSFSSVKKPIFITETGWDEKSIPGSVIAQYYKYAFESVWGKDSDKIIAVTPFLLNSQQGDFDKFSFFKDGGFTVFAKAYAQMPKVSGQPETISPPPETPTPAQKSVLGIMDFRKHSAGLPGSISSVIVKLYFKMLFGLLN